MGNLDSLKQILLNMNYDSKVTFSENKKILEQNLILENYNVDKWCTPASFELPYLSVVRDAFITFPFKLFPLASFAFPLNGQ